MKKMQVIFVALVFVLSTAVSVHSVQSTSLDNIKAGDTVYYKVSKYSLPLTDLLAGQNTGIDLSQVQLDLTGSFIGVKVMQTFPARGLYFLNSFVILGKQISIPFPAGTDPSITSIFGNSLTIPAGVGLSLGTTIPGSNLVTFLQSGNDGGIPVYIEPSNTANFKTYLDAAASQISGASLVTTDSTDTFQVVFQAQSTALSIDATLVWAKTGANAGFFQSFEVSGKILNSQNAYVNYDFAFALDHIAYNPLPTEIVNQQSQTLSVEGVNFDLSWTGGYFDAAMQQDFNQTAYNQLQSDLSALKGQDVLRYLITDVAGMYYQTEIDAKSSATAGFSTVLNSWYNGFTGSPTVYDKTCTPDCLPYDASTNPLPGLIPFLAPALTPDWNVWQANIATINALMNIVVKTYTSASVSNQLIQSGLSIDSLSFLSQLREQSNFKYFYDQLNAKASFDASKANAQNLPTGYTGNEKATFDMSGNSWTSYSDTGLIAGFGLQYNVSLGLTDIPFNSTYTGSGTLNLGIYLKLKNNAFSTLPAGTSASAVKDTLVVSNINSSPGFEIIPLLVAIVIIPVISKKRRNNK